MVTSSCKEIASRDKTRCWWGLCTGQNSAVMLPAISSNGTLSANMWKMSVELQSSAVTVSVELSGRLLKTLASLASLRLGSKYQLDHAAAVAMCRHDVLTSMTRWRGQSILCRCDVLSNSSLLRRFVKHVAVAHVVARISGSLGAQRAQRSPRVIPPGATSSDVDRRGSTWIATQTDSTCFQVGTGGTTPCTPVAPGRNVHCLGSCIQQD